MSSHPPSPPPSPTSFRVSALAQNSATPFEIRTNAAQNEAIAAELGLLGLRKMRFSGQIQARGDADWTLTATLGATVVQPCAVTLDPVTNRIDTKIERVFIKEIEVFDDDEEEIEMPEDERTDRLGKWIDVEAVMVEALSLALPEYPRKADADLQQAIFTEPGTAPMTDEAARPFAGLAALKDKLTSDD